MEKNKNLRNWKLWVGIIVVIALITTVLIFTQRNNLTPEETLSKFMYLIENKEYEKAKKLCSNNLENLETVSNLKPSNLSFTFSKDKKDATCILLEDEIEFTTMNVKMKNTITGWKIESYKVLTDLADPQIFEDRLKNGEKISNIQLLYWGESDIASKDEIAEYATNNGIVALIFAETMKTKNYNKAKGMYDDTNAGEKDLTIEQLKLYNWDNYKITNNFKILEGPKGDFTTSTVQLDDKELYIYIAGKKVITVMELKK